jgi:hypothetical protein
MSNGGVPFSDLADVAPQCFGHNAKMTFDLFHLLGVHGSFVSTDLLKNATAISSSETRMVAF